MGDTRVSTVIDYATPPDNADPGSAVELVRQDAGRRSTNPSNAFDGPVVEFREVRDPLIASPCRRREPRPAPPVRR
jgi:hypothetical protein